MRISDWSSDVCSSDLGALEGERGFVHRFLEAGGGEDGQRRVGRARGGQAGDQGEAGGEEDSHDRGYSFIWNEKLAAEAAPANAREPVGAASAASFPATGGHGATITVIASTCRTHRAGRTSSGTTSRSGPASSSSALPSQRSTRNAARLPRVGSNSASENTAR